MAKLDPRKLMEHAVEVMSRSLAEPRTDGKASPKVGAVLWKRDGTVETACRGELRDGDHAEYTLLERKNFGSNLDGAVLFATLEPCAPGSRCDPKLSCAERIVLARIKEVYVGIEDPDPKVDRKGIKYLGDHGVAVRMFDRDLQERIQEENIDFIAQALDRAAAALEEETVQPVILSPMEQARRGTALSDLSPEALEQYHRAIHSPDAVGSPPFQRRLALQGLLAENATGPVPTGFGLLLLGREPRLHMPQAGLLGTIHFADSREEPRDFDGPQVLVPGQALQWLRDKLPDPIDRTRAQRRSVNEALFELVREGIVNAIVHRDYGITGAKCQLIVTADTITVKSPGPPLAPVTLEQMKDFTAPMLSRNPVLHYVFAQMELAEERGLGLKSMKQRAQETGLPLPAFTWEDPYLVLTLYRSAESVSRTLKPRVFRALNDDERAAWEFIASRGMVVSKDLMEHLGYDERKAQRILKKLIGVGLIRRVGKGPATRYEIVG